MRAWSASVSMAVALILVVAPGLILGGCSKKGKDSASKGAKAGKASLKANPMKAVMKKPPKAPKVGKRVASKPPLAQKKKLLKPEYMLLVTALKDCKFKKDYSWDYKCPAYLELQRMRKAKTLAIKGFSKWQGQWALALIKHHSPLLRWQAVSMMSSAVVGGMKLAHVNAVIAAGEKEKDVAVLRFMIDAIDSNQMKHPQVGRFILKQLAHEHEDVRLRAVWSLAAWGKKTQGAVKAMLDTLQKEKVMKVKKAACEGAGKLEDDRVLKPLRKLALSRRTDPELHYYCLKGVIQMWTRYPFHPKKPSKKAFALTLKLLRKKGRTEKRPHWGIASMFNNLYKEKDDSYKKWAAKATWYKKQDLINAMTTIIRDQKAGWMVRTYLVETIAKLGADKKVFTKLMKAYKGKEKKHPHSYVAKALAKRI